MASVPLGVLLAEAGTRLIAAQMPVDQVPYYIRWDVDSRSLLYAIGVAVGTAEAEATGRVRSGSGAASISGGPLARGKERKRGAGTSCGARDQNRFAAEIEDITFG